MESVDGLNEESRMILSKFRLHHLARPSIQKILRFGKTAFSPRYLLYTNIVIGGQLSALGDVIQQSYQLSKPNATDSIDPKRTAMMLGAGAGLTPIAHFWYLNLDKLIPGNSIKIAVIKLIPDLLVFSPVYIIFFLILTGLMEKQSWEAFKKEVRHKSMELFSVDVCLWTPAQFINFYLLPTRFRVLYDNLVSIIADVLYSYFRYDYEVNADDEGDGDNEPQNSSSKENMMSITLQAVSD